MDLVINKDKNGEADKKMSESKDGYSAVQSISGTKRKSLEIDSQTASASLGSQVKRKCGAVRAERNTVKWLQGVINPRPSKPSAELEQFLLLGNNSIVDEVTSRVNTILCAIFPDNGFGGRFVSGGILEIDMVKCLWSEQRTEALKLYYKVLESVCSSESKRLSTKNLSMLLTNERFHRSMLACSAELVSAAYTGMNLLFPMVFETTGITAFDLSKVIETFIKHEPSLPRELRRHLNSLEEQLLESMVWEKGSSLYNSLIIAKPDLSSEIKKLGLLADPLPSLDEISIRIQAFPRALRHLSLPGQDGDVQTPKRVPEYNSNNLGQKGTTAPVARDYPPCSDGLQPNQQLPSLVLQTAFSSPNQVNEQCEGSARVDKQIKTTRIDTQISVLYNKMAKLAAIRIKNMAERLKLPHQIKERTHCLFQQILIQKTTLLFNRHVDQIILCCFYLVLKSTEIVLTFKEIKDNYMKQPQYRPEVLCSVFVDWSSSNCNGETQGSHVGIIKFYNNIFVQNAKPLLERISSLDASKGVLEINDIGYIPRTPNKSPFQSLPNVSPKKISPSQNVYLSPLQKSKKNALNSHVGKSYYAFIGESSCAYVSPSKELNAINTCLNRNKRSRRLNFDTADVYFISDSLVTGDLFPERHKQASSAGTTSATSAKADEFNI